MGPVWDNNPEYIPNPGIYKQAEICAIGLDLWQGKSGTIFDNVFMATTTKRLALLRHEEQDKAKREADKN